MVLDYGYLKNMDELAELTIHDKYLTDISFVKQMNALQCLDVSDCSIEDYFGQKLPSSKIIFCADRISASVPFHCFISS